MTTSQGNEQAEEIIITLEGELMEGGSIDLKTLTQVLQGTHGMVKEMAQLVHLSSPVTYKVTPPKEKCFEITFQAIQNAAAMAPMLPQMVDSISTVISYTKAFWEMKRLLQGAQVSKENLKQGPGNTTQVKIIPVIIGSNNVTEINFTVNAPYNAMVPAVESVSMNKGAQLIADAVARDEHVDQLKYGFSNGDTFALPKIEAPYYSYTEATDNAPDEIVGCVREINNKIYKGEFELTDGSSVKFQLDVPDNIERLDELVRDLCHAEAEKYTLALKGEKSFFKSGKKNGKIKLMKVHDIRMVDTPLDI
jgi:hypothetical protein